MNSYELTASTQICEEVVNTESRMVQGKVVENVLKHRNARPYRTT